MYSHGQLQQTVGESVKRKPLIYDRKCQKTFFCMNVNINKMTGKFVKVDNTVGLKYKERYWIADSVSIPSYICSVLYATN